MIFSSRTGAEDGSGKQRLALNAGLFAAGLIVLVLIWPFYSVPTGSRGVVTQFTGFPAIQNGVIVPFGNFTFTRLD